jgi:ribosome-associated protein
VPGPLRLRGSVVIPESELTWRFSRSSGPGGQGVNTTDSRVELLFDLAASTAMSPALRARALARLGARLSGGVLSVTSSEHRSQLRNREEAERRMGAILSEAITPPPRPRRPTKPTRGSVNRRIQAKKRRSEVKRLRRPDDRE